jgi:hypothetical protein
MRPVLRGYLKYESLFDGSVDLGDVELLNIAITLQDENERRVQLALAPIGESYGQ